MSGRKNVLLPFKLLSNQSLSASFSSAPVTIQYIDNIGITLACTGVTTNTGAFRIECSIDGIKWIDIGITPSMSLANANDDLIINLTQLPFAQLRVSFSPAGPTPNGSVVGYITGKMI
jgi:hypothetical protein